MDVANGISRISDYYIIRAQVLLEEPRILGTVEVQAD